MNTTNESAETGASQGGNSAPTSGGRKAPGKPMWVVVVIVLVVLAALIAFQSGMFGGVPAQNDDVVVTDPSTVVATVNGTTITRGELDTKASQIRLTVPAEAVGPDFEKQVLDEMVNLVLLLSRAEARGLAATATDARIDAEIANIVTTVGGQEKFDLELQNAGLSLEQLRINMKNELMIRALVDAETNVEDVSVTDEELQAAYELAFPAGGQDTPTLEQVGEMLRLQLLDQKSRSIVNQYISDVRAEAQIQSSL